MAWVRFVLIIFVNVGVHMAVQPTNPSIPSSVLMPTKKPFIQSFQSSLNAVTTPTIHKHAHKNDKTPSIRESVVILTPDSEREAQEMYDKALKQFDSYGVSTREMCAFWEKQGCQCSGTVEELTLSCRGIGINEPPNELPNSVIKLDLGNNNITILPKSSFGTVPHLEELILSDNSLFHIDSDAFIGLNNLKRLSLHNCGLSVVPEKALSHLTHLNALQLDDNALMHLDDISLAQLKNLRVLRLEGNMLQRVPTQLLTGLPSLEVLNIGGNHLLNINAGDFPRLNHLQYLTLKRNRLTNITVDAISNLTNLKILDLDDNLLTEIPKNLAKLSNLQELFLSGNRLNAIHKDDLPKSIVTLELRGNPLGDIKYAFQSMSRLKKLVLSDAKNLSELPSFEGCSALEILRMDRANISIISNTLCRNSSRLRSLEFKSNKLQMIPDLTLCKDLRILDVSDNRISSVHGMPFKGLGQLHDLLLSYNQITTIPKDAFVGVPRLQLLDLEGNKISFIHEDSFAGFLQLEDLNLGNNIFPTLPKSGLRNVLHLKTFNNPKLRSFPPPQTFPRIETLVLSYAYHCCAFIPLLTATSTSSKAPPLQEAVLFPTDNEFDMSLWNSSQTDIWPQLHNLSKKFGSQINELWDSFGQDFTYPGINGNLPAYVEEYFEEETSPTKTLNGELATGSVQCLPLPGPFLPCQDLFDWWTLRCGVWIVFLLAMLGNGTVVFVLIFSRSKMDVPRFLVCNLAAADFFMGIYLGMLAVVDASTLSEFRMYAIPWQMSIGCQIAGFLAVLSSELSVYTLAVITLERNYAITHAMHLNKRLSLRHAGYIMIFGWMFSLTMAVLPLIGVSDYRKFAVCLPFQTSGPYSLAYVVFLMFINGVAFVILMGCYLRMYCAIRGSQAWNSNDSRIAKRMALLVFTDFLCWSPVAFLSLTAVFGVHLINLNQAKVLTVFVLPLNSCCNPFLYAIMTKQFKKDCVMICKAIEESRVTRGIGRCRHSSNFSNRQTPINTNSVGERSSKEIPQLMPLQTCACAKLLEQTVTIVESPPTLWTRFRDYIVCNKTRNRSNHRRDIRCEPYTYHAAGVQQKPFKRTISMSSDNFSSSRSDSWRHGPTHHCSIPLRMLDNRRRHSSWLIARKTSHDSNFSSSRNDSSSTSATASTSTSRLSRSSATSTTPVPSFSGKSSLNNTKPCLVRQQAIQSNATTVDEISRDKTANTTNN